jgi:hypothetical protein
MFHILFPFCGALRAAMRRVGLRAINRQVKRTNSIPAQTSSGPRCVVADLKEVCGACSNSTGLMLNNTSKWRSLETASAEIAPNRNWSVEWRQNHDLLTPGPAMVRHRKLETEPIPQEWRAKTMGCAAAQAH